MVGRRVIFLSRSIRIPIRLIEVIPFSWNLKWLRIRSLIVLGPSSRGTRLRLVVPLDRCILTLRILTRFSLRRGSMEIPGPFP